MVDHEPFPGGRTALVLVLLLALIGGAITAGALWTAGARADRALAAHRHQVTATTTGPAKELPVATRYGAHPQAVAPAVWGYPDDVRRTGSVAVPPGSPRGRTVVIWVDDAGAQARPPGSAADRALLSLSGGTATAFAVGGVGAGVLLLVRRTVQARGLAAWEREWEQVEPVWSGRLRRGSGQGTEDD
ncbi:Rv1733c family protein [Streptomyces showdoensis]|uniref:Integral membrane protein n=1 Tax=Streptomyces showdoensis TaxID=68268 RepID=A0A2P2GWU9_STREW|nr:hypothetical protein [Streptomyces showdoensis]KKZ75425.1 hypothetical protein VO63_03035 [Streptomyces showdoensis]